MPGESGKEDLFEMLGTIEPFQAAVDEKGWLKKHTPPIGFLAVVQTVCMHNELNSRHRRS